MKKLKVSLLFLAAVMSGSAFAQDLSGTWQQIDDKTGSQKAIIEIRKESNGTFVGKIIKVSPRPGYTPRDTCVNIDPLSGKIYDTKVRLNASGKRLTLRGYMGVSALGRSQTWIRQE